MSTLTEVVTQGSITNALTGVKRPLSGNPTSIPNQLPAFRGVPNTPGNAVKAPKLSAGNRVDRGTNVTTPVARVTALTSIAIDNGRLSPGDVAFVRRTPGGYARANAGPSYHGQSPGIDHLTDLFGVDGVNRFLSGTLNGSRSWRHGDNMLIGYEFDDATDLYGINQNTGKPVLAALREYRPDGVILSNEEPHSFLPTGGRDATVFNLAVKGPAPTNNGFMTYQNHAPTELYARGADPLAYGTTLRVGSERASDTWHGKIGYDFVAAYTAVYTEYPLQMFDRNVRVLDSVYLLLRAYNLWDDVVEPRVANLMKMEVLRQAADGKSQLTKKYANKDEAYRSVLSALNVKIKNGNKKVFTYEDGSKGATKKALREMIFFQYMPCSSRAFARFHETLKLVDESLSDAEKETFKGLLCTDSKERVLRKKSVNMQLTKKLREARRFAYMNTQKKIYEKDRVNEHDAVRFLDVLFCAGAWKIGKTIDTRSARATPYANGPTSASYRMNVMVDLEWLPRNKTLTEDALGDRTERRRVSDRLRRPPYYWKSDGKVDRRSDERAFLSRMAKSTLAERELFEEPLLPIPNAVNGKDKKSSVNNVLNEFMTAASPAELDLFNVWLSSLDEEDNVENAHANENADMGNVESRATQATTQTTARKAPAPATPTAAPVAPATRAPATRAPATRAPDAAVPAGVDTQPLVPAPAASAASAASGTSETPGMPAMPGTSTATPANPSKSAAPKPTTKSTPLVDSTIAAAAARKKASALSSSMAVASNPAATSATTATITTTTTTVPVAATAAPARPTGVVDEVFNQIFGTSATSSRSPLASPSSPTPSSGSETGPRAYSRRNR